MENKIKNNGVVYTPEYIVKIILEQSGYSGNQILKKHVIDNSCGDGKFLINIVKRYIDEYFLFYDNNLLSVDGLKNDLETYIHGIEIDEIEVKKCIDNLNEIVKSIGIDGLDWDINQGDTLQSTKYNGKMDYVIGNPPYVRVHNLNNNFEYVKSQKFTSSGMTDLFIIFYEIGINMLNDKGVLSYITPSSIFHSIAGSEFRKYIINNKLLTSVIDLKHYQAFDNFTTYTTILTLDKTNSRKIVEYFEFDENKLSKKFISFLHYDEFYLNDSFYFSEKQNLTQLKNILDVNLKDNSIEVKNGFATLADRFFIKKSFDFKSKYLKKVIKASRMEWNQIIYPYDSEGKIIDFELFETELQEYFNLNYDMLKSRSLDKNSRWYSFGRTQGINDFYKEKISINTLLRNVNDIKLELIKPGEGVYSGLYIIFDSMYNYDTIKETLLTDEFTKYISLLGKYKSGGYYTFSSGDLKRFLIYKLNERKKV